MTNKTEAALRALASVPSLHPDFHQKIVDALHAEGVLDESPKLKLRQRPMQSSARRCAMQAVSFGSVVSASTILSMPTLARSVSKS
jgi:hypothetical protein